MNTLKFRTNIKCGGCLEKAAPALNHVAGLDNWSMDTQTPEKMLTIVSGDITSENVILALKKAGFTAEKLD